MNTVSHKPHINFHIGAPRIADGLIKHAVATKLFRSDRQVRVLKTGEFQKYLRPFINGSGANPGFSESLSKDTTDFWEQLSRYKTVVASQHAMMGHPKEVVKNGLLLPNAHKRVEKLSAFFDSTSMDIHLAILDQTQYLSKLPASNITNNTAKLHTSESLPSWFELVSRIRNSCPNNRLIIWDFSNPTAIALPFVMTILNLDEVKLEKMKKPVADYFRQKSIMARIVQGNDLDNNFCYKLDEQFENDLDNLETLENTIIVRSEDVPLDFHFELEP